MLTKLSSTEVNGFFVKAAGTIRSLLEENQQLRGQLAEKDRMEYAEKIAHEAVERGIMGEDEAKEYADSLANSEQDLSMVEEFVGRAAAGLPLGESLQKTASEHLEGDSDGSGDVLTNFLLTSDIAG